MRVRSSTGSIMKSYQVNEGFMRVLEGFNEGFRVRGVLVRLWWFKVFGLGTGLRFVALGFRLERLGLWGIG